MDMPIRIMITLFVALVVGSTIIVFSKQMIERSKVDIQNVRPGEDPSKLEEQKIINLNTVDTNQLIDLMEECYNRHTVQTLDKELCFAVIAKNGDWFWADIETYFANLPDFNGNITISPDVGDGDYAMSIYFDPYGQFETIELTK